LDLDLGVLCGFPPLFFLSYPSIAFVAFVGFGREGFEHFVCSCHCIWCIGLSSPRSFGSESSLSFLLLGSWNPRRPSGLVVTWGPPIKLWRSSQALWCLCGNYLGTSN
jgi:hypothetical protein